MSRVDPITSFPTSKQEEPRPGLKTPAIQEETETPIISLPTSKQEKPISVLPDETQVTLDEERVMLQGFFWESYRYGHPERFPELGDKKWYEIVKEQAKKIKAARFDLIWLPPPSYAGKYSAGYNPKEYFNLNNSYGYFEQHRAMLKALLENGIEPIADIVINHRDGSTGWANFKNPTWDTWAICQDDEAFSDNNSEVFNTPIELRGAGEEHPKYVEGGETTYQSPNFRDLDHTNETVRCDIVEYLKQLKSMGYRGWRYDMAHGYHAKWIAYYNKVTNPTFSAGEYSWDKDYERQGWIWNTATTPGVLKTSSSMFDFRTFFILKNNQIKYKTLYDYGKSIQEFLDSSSGLIWRDKAITFVENHDTGYRTNEDGTPEKHHEHDNFANNWEVEQAYAYILTHPGVPTIYWKHYFDWGSDLQNKIKALINARKIAGVHAGSDFYPQNNARKKRVYAAMVKGRRIGEKRTQLYVRLGGTDNDWQPSSSNYKDYREYAHGTGWKVWITLPGNPELQQTPFNKALPVPDYKAPVPCDTEKKVWITSPSIPEIAD